jgi:7,8-dihydropterin-6-yl-methyl-4-(beta-D-ribofuranosyl)aminobenzene 5'-phosphate synthase
MLTQTVQLREVDEVRLTTVVDNMVDVLMASNEVARRLEIRADSFERPMPIAEHGFASLITTRIGDRVGQVFLDTGSSPMGILHNIDAMSLDLSELDAIVISHGHADHTLGLTKLLSRLAPHRVRVVAHPDAFLERRVVLPKVTVRMPPLTRDLLDGVNVELIETADPTLLLDGMLLVSGEIVRTTTFESGFPANQSRRDGEWAPDPLMHDDQCVAVNVRGKGLVIVSGCGHAGIVNSVRHVQAITGIDAVHAIIGGYHLQNPQLIAPTVSALKEIGPRYVVPTHCTGWAAIHEFARMMPEAFIANSVGTTLVF